MIRKKNQVQTKKNQDMRGGHGEVMMEHLLEKDQNELYGKGRLFSKITLKPNCSVGFHIHEGEMECYHILKGSPLYDDNGTESRLEPGDTTFTPDGQGHAIANDTQEIVEFIALILYA